MFGGFSVCLFFFGNILGLMGTLPCDDGGLLEAVAPPHARFIITVEGGSESLRLGVEGCWGLSEYKATGARPEPLRTPRSPLLHRQKLCLHSPLCPVGTCLTRLTGARWKQLPWGGTGMSQAAKGSPGLPSLTQGTVVSSAPCPRRARGYKLAGQTSAGSVGSGARTSWGKKAHPASGSGASKCLSEPFSACVHLL